MEVRVRASVVWRLRIHGEGYGGFGRLHRSTCWPFNESGGRGKASNSRSGWWLGKESRLGKPVPKITDSIRRLGERFRYGLEALG